MRTLLLCGLLLSTLSGCAVFSRARRVFGPDHNAFERQPTGRHAQVLVTSGWEGESPVPYAPRTAFEHDGVSWTLPVMVTDRGHIQVVPRHEAVQVRVFVRSTGLDPRGFRPVVARTGTVAGHEPKVVRFLPSAPLEGPWVLDVGDLQNPWSPDRMKHGDILLVEVGVAGEEPERYLFDTHDFGWRTNAGASVLVRLPLVVHTDAEALPSPALTMSMKFGYRPRTQDRFLEFLGERMTVVASVGVGSTVLEQVSGPIDQQIQGAFDALLVGGGVEWFDFINVQLLASARGVFDPDVPAEWTIAAGFDAVQAGRFFANVGERLVREYPLRENRRRKRW